MGYPLNRTYRQVALEAVIHNKLRIMLWMTDRLYFEKENSALTKTLLEENQLENLAKIFTEKIYQERQSTFLRYFFGCIKKTRVHINKNIIYIKKRKKNNLSLQKNSN